jgi:luciferase family oxidoreductase group 1
MADMIPLSLLDLAPIVQGSDASQAFRQSLDLARHAERLGYHRYWLAEHHNMPGIASAATAVALAHVGAGTSTIRIGAGGIMLPNHAPLMVAEAFGTLAALHPGRIDLGLGRAPGTDQRTAHALRRTLVGGEERFPNEVVELLHWFEPVKDGQAVRAVPGAGEDVEVWILGSSTFGAQLAAMLGLPYAFASHFAPAELDRAIAIYREQFQPSERLKAPSVMPAATVIAADSDEEARFLFSSLQQSFIALRTGRAAQLPPPVPGMDATMEPAFKLMLEQALACAVIGGPETVRAGLEAFIRRTGADELIITGSVFEQAARLRSFEIAMEAHKSLAKAA